MSRTSDHRGGQPPPPPLRHARAWPLRRGLLRSRLGARAARPPRPSVPSTSHLRRPRQSRTGRSPQRMIHPAPAAAAPHHAWPRGRLWQNAPARASAGAIRLWLPFRQLQEEGTADHQGACGTAGGDLGAPPPLVVPVSSESCQRQSRMEARVAHSRPPSTAIVHSVKPATLLRRMANTLVGHSKTRLHTDHPPWDVAQGGIPQTRMATEHTALASATTRGKRTRQAARSKHLQQQSRDARFAMGPVTGRGRAGA